MGGHASVPLLSFHSKQGQNVLTRSGKKDMTQSSAQHSLRYCLAFDTRSAVFCSVSRVQCFIVIRAQKVRLVHMVV